MKIDGTGRGVGPNRVWMKTKSKPGLAMSRSLGDTVASKLGVISIPDIFEFTLTSFHKILIIASDGIWGVLSNEKAMYIAGKSYEQNNANLACEELIEEATIVWNNLGENIDDITVIVVFLK